MDAMPLRILGAGGHATVAADAWQASGGEVIAFHSDGSGEGEGEAPESISRAIATRDPLHIAIGDNNVRKRIASGVEDARFPPVIHPSAILSGTATIRPGALLCALAVLQPRCRVGRHSIINTGAIVEHDCEIGDFVHLAPGARLAGGVIIEEGAFVGLGAIVIPGVRIGAFAVVGAGAVVIRDVEPETVVAGNPAHKLR